MKRSSFATLALAAAALCASCSGAPSPAPKSVTEAKGAVSPVIDVPARAASKVSLPGLWYSSKGHESYQEFADTVSPFDDRQVVRELIGIKAIKPGG